MQDNIDNILKLSRKCFLGNHMKAMLTLEASGVFAQIRTLSCWFTFVTIATPYLKAYQKQSCSVRMDPKLKNENVVDNK